jgi:outer membrane protein assembly factor BamB
MDPLADRIVLLAAKHTVIAFDKQTGARRWTRDLGGGLSGDFVTLLADTTRAYAHARGRFFCLDLATGAVLWQDELHGLGFGVGSIALPGGPTTGTPAAPLQQEQLNQAAAAATSGTA